MSISSISFAFFSIGDTAATTVRAAKAVAAASAAPADPCADTGGCAPQAKRNVLYDAMMSALKEMGLVGSSAPADTTTTKPEAAASQATQPASAACTAAPASDSCGSVSKPSATTEETGTKDKASAATSVGDAVFKFANALAQALRGDSAGVKTDAAAQSDAGSVQPALRHQHHDHQARASRSYAGMAERLGALAVAVDAGVKSAAAPAAATATPAAATSTTAAPALVTLPVTPAADAVTKAAPSTIAAAPAALPATTDVDVPTAPKPATNSLVDAFAGLLDALKAASPSVAPVKDAAASQLGKFLHLLSEALQPSSDAPAHMQVGILIDVTA